ncbi:hypothetical protein DMC64_36855 [Amycolatopsis sp. WAC 04197]|nr:hypothetical protein DMC64_36855 [Amycolatopsis sp. WAC 04197]
MRRTETGVAGDFAVADGEVDSLGVYHLSAVTALVVASQLIVVGVHIDQELRRKSGEVFLHDISLRCRRQVNVRDGSCELDFVRRRKTAHGMYYKVSCSVESGAFVGTASVLHSLPGAATGS